MNKFTKPESLTVSKLIAALQELPGDLVVLGGDHDGWFYDLHAVTVEKVSQGRITGSGEDVVCLRT